MAQTKIKSFATLNPQKISSVQQERLRALAGISTKASDIAFNFAAKKREAEGRLEGIQSVERDEQGNIKAPELKSELTIFGQSFNRAAILAHQQAAKVSVNERLASLEQESLDPEEFKKRADAIRSGTLSGLPVEVSAPIAQEIDSSISSRAISVAKNFYRAEQKKQSAQVAAGIDSSRTEMLNAARKGDIDRLEFLTISNDTAIDEGVASGLIDPIKAEQIKQGIKKDVIKQDALRQIEGVAFNASLGNEEKLIKGSEILEKIRTSNIKGLDPDEKDSLVRIVESKVRDISTQIKQEDAARVAAKEREVSNLKISVNVAKSGFPALVEETERFFNDGLISGAERTSLITSIVKKQEEIQKQNDGVSLVAQKINGEFQGFIEPKVIDKYYQDRVIPNIEALPEDDKVFAKANYINALKILPKSIKNEISNNIASRDPELIKQSAMLIDEIDKIEGIAEDAIGPSQRAFMKAYLAVSDFMEPEQATELALKQTDPANKQIAESKELQIKSEKLREKYSGIVDSEFSNFFGGDFLREGVNKEIVTKEYSDLFETYFKSGMSKEDAQETALKLLTRNWKDSSFGFMKHPPELYYSVNGKTDYLIDQAFDDINQTIIGTTATKEEIFLVSDDRTAKEAAAGRPSYRIFYIDQETGMIEAPPFRWAPDVQKELKRQGKKDFIEQGKKIREKSTLTEEKRMQQLSKGLRSL